MASLDYNICALLQFLLTVAFSSAWFATRTKMIEKDKKIRQYITIITEAIKNKGIIVSIDDKSRIKDPTEGLLVQDRTDNNIYTYINNKWQKLS